jgi:hypothetical protein
VNETFIVGCLVHKSALDARDKGLKRDVLARLRWASGVGDLHLRSATHECYIVDWHSSHMVSVAVRQLFHASARRESSGDDPIVDASERAVGNDTERGLGTHPPARGRRPARHARPTVVAGAPAGGIGRARVAPWKL